jgi:hypothetical protein
MPPPLQMKPNFEIAPRPPSDSRPSHTKSDENFAEGSSPIHSHRLLYRGFLTGILRCTVSSLKNLSAWQPCRPLKFSRSSPASRPLSPPSRSSICTHHSTSFDPCFCLALQLSSRLLVLISASTIAAYHGDGERGRTADH